ncbi:MAG TPA: MFS transporter [Tepidisphaeraceae bacterium]|jgi:MFS family permease|nr:MFS transporter [Tepidisphaeraceae bacterium]
MDLLAEKAVAPPAAARRHLSRVFSLEGLGSIGANLLMYGIFFYMQKRFGWGARRNLLLSSGQGVAYVLGALSAAPLSQRVHRRTLLVVLHTAMAAIALTSVCFPNPALLVALLPLYTMFSAAQWPLLESLISIDATPDQISRRISVYNLVWSGTGAVTVSLCGLVIAHFPQGIFLITVAVHLISLGFLPRLRAPMHNATTPQLHPEPELLELRTLAMRLSRIALPATFAVIYALGAIMPTLPVIRSADPEIRTLLAGVWMIARWFCFILLGVTAWWHTRPRALLVAAAIVLISFVGATLIDSTISMVLWQIAMGVAMGLIYSSSLYFGMVLSDGSTVQNAYHEALIGVGSVLGPGCGALAEIILPGNPHASVIAVGTILFLSVLAASWVSLQSRPSRRRRVAAR